MPKKSRLENNDDKEGTMCSYKKKKLLGRRGFAVVLVLMIITGLVQPLSAMAETENGEGSVSTAADAAEMLKTDAPAADVVEMESADEEAKQMLDDLEEKNGAVIFAAADNNVMDVPAASSDQVVLNYTKIIRHEDWFTRSFTVQYDGKRRVAYCIEPKDYPPDKGTHTAVKYDNDLMTKALYYAYGYPGYEKTTKAYLAGCSMDDDYRGNDGAYVMSHLVLSYFYDNESTGSDAFKGLSQETKTLVKNMAYALKNQWADVPEDASLAFDISEVAAEWNPDKQYQETPVITLKGHRDNKITVTVPAGATMIRLSDNELTEYTSGENEEELQRADVYGGDEFFFTAPGSVKGRYASGKMTGSLQEFQSYLIKVTSKQDILYCGDGARDSVEFSIKWADIGSFVLNKVSASPEITDGNDAYSLEHAEYGIYADGQLYEEIETNAEGGGEVLLPYGEYTLKELEAPKGYAVDTASHEISIESGQTVFEHEEQIAPEKTVPDSSPKTGDGDWLLFGTIAALTAAAVILRCLRKKADL